MNGVFTHYLPHSLARSRNPPEVKLLQTFSQVNETDTVWVDSVQHFFQKIYGNENIPGFVLSPQAAFNERVATTLLISKVREREHSNRTICVSGTVTEN